MTSIDGQKGLVLFSDGLNLNQIRRGGINVEQGVSDDQNSILLGLPQLLELAAEVLRIEVLVGMHLLGGVVGALEKSGVSQLINQSAVVVFNDGLDEAEAGQPA